MVSGLLGLFVGASFLNSESDSDASGGDVSNANDVDNSNTVILDLSELLAQVEALDPEDRDRLYDQLGVSDEPEAVTTTATTATTVAPPSPEAALAEMEPQSGDGWESATDINIDGERYNGIESSSLWNCGDERVVEYSIGRDWAGLEAVVGLSEDSASGQRADVEIFDENHSSLWEGTLIVGDPQEISIEWGDPVLRLVIVATRAPDDTGACDESVRAALGEPTLVAG